MLEPSEFYCHLNKKKYKKGEHKINPSYKLHVKGKFIHVIEGLEIKIDEHKNQTCQLNEKSDVLHVDDSNFLSLFHSSTSFLSVLVKRPT